MFFIKKDLQGTAADNNNSEEASNSQTRGKILFPVEDHRGVIVKDKTVTITKPTLKDKDVDFEYFVDEKYKGYVVYRKSKGSLEMITDIGFSTK